MQNENGSSAVSLYNGNNIARNLEIKKVGRGIYIGDLSNTASYLVSNNLILMNQSGDSGILHIGSGAAEISNNVIFHTRSNVSTYAGFLFQLGNPGRTVIKNNLVAGFMWQQYDDSEILDSIFIINNVFGYTRNYSQFTNGAIYMAKGNKRVVKNNIIFNTKVGIDVYNAPALTPDYNLYWDLEQNYRGQVIGGENEITTDPMVMKDTLPAADMKLDMHLQAFSPAIDAGDPSILDKDGTRSDIGMFGGPGGDIYKYIDLAPREPRGLIVISDTNSIIVSWKKNTEADFSHYRLFRDTIPGFKPDTSSFVTSLTDTIYTHIIPAGEIQYYYKLSAVDSQDNESEFSDEIGIIVSVKGETLIVDEYRLYQNYPNPFNPKTTISYRLKERSNVKITIYDIKGELIDILINEEQEKGYYEVEFNGGRLSSGVYLCRIEVIGEGRIPRFSDMKKMLMIK